MEINSSQPGIQLSNEDSKLDLSPKLDLNKEELSQT